MFCVFFFFKQKTAYEMRISDWSSDVCSSDLSLRPALPIAHLARVQAEAILRHQRAAIEQEGRRSEEHTSELQSLMRISYAVFCLKKKKTHKKQKHIKRLKTNRHATKRRLHHTQVLNHIQSSRGNTRNMTQQKHNYQE